MKITMEDVGLLITMFGSIWLLGVELWSVDNNIKIYGYWTDLLFPLAITVIGVIITLYFQMKRMRGS